MSKFEWVTKRFEGRHTAAIFAFFVTGNVFHYFHRLDDVYIHFMMVTMGFVLGHSVKEDYFAGKVPPTTGGTQ